ncbi:hypothetical protein ACFWU5_25985 [Nocardia sp. NPDC058640]|uniref:hypothetical protein n=1 Tax=Nocardia sp. NPDC058640 TaxID=3346571 RepID=UPI00364920A2
MLGMGVVDSVALELDSLGGRPRQVRRAQQLAVWQLIYGTGAVVLAVTAAAILPPQSPMVGMAGSVLIAWPLTVLLAAFTLSFTQRSRYAHALGWYGAALVIPFAALGVLTLPIVVTSVAMIVLLDRPASKHWFEVAETPELRAFRNHTTTLPAWTDRFVTPIRVGWTALLGER